VYGRFLYFHLGLKGISGAGFVTLIFSFFKLCFMEPFLKPIRSLGTPGQQIKLSRAASLVNRGGPQAVTKEGLDFKRKPAAFLALSSSPDPVIFLTFPVFYMTPPGRGLFLLCAPSYSFEVFFRLCLFPTHRRRRKLRAIFPPNVMFSRTHTSRRQVFLL